MEEYNIRTYKLCQICYFPLVPLVFLWSLTQPNPPLALIGYSNNGCKMFAPVKCTRKYQMILQHSEVYFFVC